MNQNNPLQDFFNQFGQGPQFKKPKSKFTLDKKKRIKFDPNTGEFIEPNERRSLKNFNKNPFQINPGNAIFPAAPNPLSGLGQLGGGGPSAGGNANIQDILSKLGGLF